MLGFAHTAVCVPSVDRAVEWYRDVLGLVVLSPPYEMSGPAIERDMGALVPAPVVVKAAIVGVGSPSSLSDRVLEVIEYPAAGGGAVIDRGITHVGLVCSSVAAERARLSALGVVFVTDVASVAGLQTTWFRDPWGNLFILMEKSFVDRPYWRQWSS